MQLPESKSLSLVIAVANTEKDLLFAHELQKHLKILIYTGQFTYWFLDQILAGDDQNQVIEERCQQADLFLLLLSSDFWDSPDCRYLNQLAQERQREGLARVYQIKLRAVNIEKLTFQYSKILPLNDKSIDQWSDRDQALTTIAGQIRAVVARAHLPVFLTIDPRLTAHRDRIVATLNIAHISPLSEAILQAVSLSEIIRRVSSVLVLLSKETSDEDQPMEEVRRVAAIHACPLIVVWIGQQLPGKVLPGLWSGKPFVWIESPSFSRDLLCLIQNRLDPVAVASRQDNLRNPYKGLRAFQPDDADNFFGRTALINELFSMLKDVLQSDQARLLAVIGLSGVGKSSVVQAGLLPRLKTGDMAGRVRWEIIKPGNKPLDALMLLLVGHLPEVGITKITDDLKAEKDDILHVYIRRIAEKLSVSNVVLVVDQLEELFLPEITDDVRRRFLILLSEAVTIPQGPLLVVLTLRIDFRHRFTEDFPDFFRLLDAHSSLVLPMEEKEMLEVIKQPASNVQVEFDENLAGRILLESQGQANALPMLQFVLEQLFEMRDGQYITQKAYDDIGGVKGAMRQWADKTYDYLSGEQHKGLVKIIFRHMVTLGTFEQGVIRKQVPLADLLALADASKLPTMQMCINAFVDAHLLIKLVIADVTMIEICHEAILQEWPLLKGWIDEWNSDLYLEKALNRRIEQKKHLQEIKPLLYRGKALKEMKRWTKRNKPNEQQLAFLADCYREVRHSVRRVVLLVSLVLIVIGASIGGVILWQVLHAPNPNLVANLQDDGVGSLRWCLATAQTGSTIMIDPTLKGIITLNKTLIISNPITIKGPGENVLALRSLGVTAGIVIDADATGIVSISNLGFTQGSPASTPLDSTAISIANTSIVHLDHIMIAHNHKMGIVNSGGTLTLTNSMIADNSPSGLKGASIGGINNTIGGKVTIINTTITGNASSPDKGSGTGGVFNDGTMTITNTTITGNISSNKVSVGGVFNDGTMTIANSTISGNSSFSGTGGDAVGGVANSGGSMTIANTTITGNTSSGVGGTNIGGVASGGGAVNSNGHMTITNSTISDNLSSGVGGTNIGGVFSGNGTMTLANSTITDNASFGAGMSRIGGMLNSVGTLTIVNSTISHNASSGATSIYTNGGGKTILFFCTIAENTDGDGIFVTSATKEETSTMIAQDTIIISAPIVIQDPSSVFQSSGYNLVDAANTSFFQQTGDRVIQNPSALFENEDFLASNGGATQTIKIRVGSEAYNAIPVQACHIQAIYNTQTHTYTDQRDQPRPAKGKTQCDIGAYEA